MSISSIPHLTSQSPLLPNSVYVAQGVPSHQRTFPKEPAPLLAPRTQPLLPFAAASAQHALAIQQRPPHFATDTPSFPPSQRMLILYGNHPWRPLLPTSNAVPVLSEQPPYTDTVHLSQPDEATPHIAASTSILHRTHLQGGQLLTLSLLAHIFCALVWPLQLPYNLVNAVSQTLNT